MHGQYVAMCWLSCACRRRHRLRRRLAAPTDDLCMLAASSAHGIVYHSMLPAASREYLLCNSKCRANRHRAFAGKCCRISIGIALNGKREVLPDDIFIAIRRQR